MPIWFFKLFRLKRKIIIYTTMFFGGLFFALFSVKFLNKVASPIYLKSNFTNLRWEFCISENVREPDIGSCNWRKIRVPQAFPPDTSYKELEGLIVFKTHFLGLDECKNQNSACSLVFGEIGDAAQVKVNGITIGNHGRIFPDLKYAKQYAVAFSLPPNIIKQHNELLVYITTLKKPQTGLTRIPIGITSTLEAERLVFSTYIKNIFLPLAAAVGLILLASFLVVKPIPSLQNSKVQDPILLYCISNTLFLLSFTEIPREYLPPWLAIHLHFFFRYSSDFSLALLVIRFFDLSKNIEYIFNSIYCVALSTFVFSALSVFNLNGVELFQFGTSKPYLITNSIVILKILPFLIWGYGSIKSNRRKERFILIPAFVIFLAMQINDIGLFRGWWQSSYYVKFYPMLIALIFTYFMLRRAHEIEIEERSNAAVNTALANMSRSLAHDLSAPFYLLHESIRVLREESDPNRFKSQSNEVIKKLNSTMMIVDTLVHDVMNVGRTKPRKAKYEPVQIEDVFLDVTDFIGNMFPEKQDEIQVSFNHRSPVYANKVSLFRVFVNVLKNAFENKGEGGTINISTSDYNDGRCNCVKICISNTHSFLSAMETNSIFEVFFSNSRSNGNGLGLAIAKQIISENSGEIWCESLKNEQYPFGLVMFYVTLPSTIS